MDFRLDRSFMLKVNQHKVKEYHAAIVVLDFETEKPLARLEGKVVSGNLNVAANSPVRRTGSFRLLFDKDTYNITDVSNLIAIDKKISLSLGIDNPFYHTEEYHKYGETLWFKQGTFVILKANSTIGANGLGVSVNLQDKMAFLNGTCGGTFPASVSLHERLIFDNEGNKTVQYPLIRDIIKEVVHHFGGEHFSRIVVDDVPATGRITMQYVGTTPINFATKEDALSPEGWKRAPGGSFIIGNPPVPGYLDTYIKGENVGYEETPLTFPGELVLNGGATVTRALDEIVKALGNYEYFYDVDGVFHFQRKKNFIATGNTPLNLSPQEDSQLQSLYCPRYSPDILLSEFSNASLVSSLSFNPNYGNIKNDFVYWGTRQTKDKKEIMVRYHLAIDERPKDIPLSEGLTRCSLCHRDIVEIKSIDDDTLLRYEILNNQGIAHLNKGEKEGKNIAPCLDRVFPDGDGFDWREELYRRALVAYGNSTQGSYYDQELLAEWRNVYDPTSISSLGKESYQYQWEAKYGVGNPAHPWTGYRVETLSSPEKLRYWLDLIDTTSALGKYSVQRIGRRSVVKIDNKINEVYSRAVNDIIFVKMPKEEDRRQEMWDKIRNEYIPIGQTYSVLQQDQWPYFIRHNSFGTCYEGVRSLMYQHLVYNSTVSMNIIPLLYLEPDKIIHIKLPEFGVVGDYIINTIGMSIGNNPSMSLGLQEAFTVV